ncbi:CDGSH iron-sulfur domain-containing protein 3, mitochondrial-like [Saccostrea echinata]|uniref:CDGSH iron-sulfur domain-containing protein 3, mitochondrial-like n=1 Tax=Saccostrea echinata TaxID=191078 RepID=UPI002A834748|nr:CDGSH iron-sulfur domain-containing protein 3, mitochondrial-like [Saccostrea echinata]
MALSIKNLSSLRNIFPFRQSHMCLMVRHKYFFKKYNPEGAVYREYKNEVVKNTGKVYDKKPAKVVLKPGKKYHWCSCGYGHSQPLCDGTHKTLAERRWTKVKFHPKVFEVEEEKTYFLCNCKQTKNPPFCDGTHRNKEIQDKIKG